jgi:hypothetical protein
MVPATTINNCTIIITSRLVMKMIMCGPSSDTRGMTGTETHVVDPLRQQPSDPGEDIIKLPKRCNVII